MLVEQLERVCLVAVVVLAEYHVDEVLLVVYERQGVELVVPDDVVCGLEAGVRRGGDQLVERSHELLDLSLAAHAGYTVVAARYDAEQLAVCRAVIGDGHGGVAGALLEGQYLCKGGLRLYVGVGNDEAGLVALDAGYHSRFAFDRLRTVDEGNAALLRQCDRHAVIGYRLHDRRYHRDIGIQRRLFTLLEFYDRGAQAYVRRHALCRRITRHQQIFIEGMRGFTEIIRHVVIAPFLRSGFI